MSTPVPGTTYASVHHVALALVAERAQCSDPSAWENQLRREVVAFLMTECTLSRAAAQMDLVHELEATPAPTIDVLEGLVLTQRAWRATTSSTAPAPTTAS